MCREFSLFVSHYSVQPADQVLSHMNMTHIGVSWLWNVLNMNEDLYEVYISFLTDHCSAPSLEYLSVLDLQKVIPKQLQEELKVWISMS